MKFPALWILAAFAAGIEAARVTAFSPGLFLIAAISAMAVAGVLLWQKQATVAWVAVLLAWASTGAAAAVIERVSAAPNEVARLIVAGRLDTGSPLRWRGQLRAEPAGKPWGREYVIDLDQVETAAQTVAVRGGLRLTLYNDAGSGTSVDGLRAGDRVEALVKAQPPRNFNDPGAFDTRSYLATQGIDVTGSLRSAELLTLLAKPAPGWRQRLARAHGALLQRIDRLFAGQPASAAILRAMLLGDRSFVDTSVATAFQATAAYHVLVVAGLHTGALVVFLLWLCRRLRLGTMFTIFFALAVLAAYVGVVEDRPPIIRAALMATLYLLGRPFFRRVDPLNAVSLAAMILLAWSPRFIGDESFQLSFLAAGAIAALAVPTMARITKPYLAGLGHLGDVTRDVIHPPKIAQFRIETRGAAQWLAKRMPARLAARSAALICAPMRVGLRLGELLLLSTTIQLGMLPLLARDFHRVSLSGPFSNIPAVLLTGVIVPLGFGCLAASFLWTGLAALLARILGWLTIALLSTIEWFSRLPHLSYRIPGPPAWLLVAFLGGLTLLAAAGRQAVARRAGRAPRRRLPEPIAWQEWAAAVAVTAGAVLVASYPFTPNLPKARTEVTVLDVGQGDSLFVSFPDGETMLVDGGGVAGSAWMKGMRAAPDIGEEVVSPYLWSRGLKRLDVIVLTHAHMDHLGGLASVMANFPVRELWIGRDERTPAFQALLNEAAQRGVRVVHRTEGEKLAWGSVRGEVMWPPVEEPTDEASNDDSLALRITDNTTSFLLTGDIQEREEKEILSEGEPLTADFLKVPHHGSKTSSTEPFLAAVDPRIAVISVGENNTYGHPSESVVERYAQDGIRLLRTDRDGAVTALSDGKGISVRTFLNTAEIAAPSKAER